MTRSPWTELAPVAVPTPEVGPGVAPNLPEGDKLVRLAVDQSEQRQGVESLLLAKALRKAVAAGEAAAARLIVVDAFDDRAVRFYQAHGFVAVPDHPRRLFLRLQDVRASLDRSG